MKIAMKLILSTLFLLGFVTNVPAQTGAVTFTWTAPTTGTAVEHYEAYAVTDTLDAWGSQVASALPDTNAVTLTIPDGTTVFVRVRGVDAEGRMGPFSQWSEPYLYQSPPTGCGRPEFVGRR